MNGIMEAMTNFVNSPVGGLIVMLFLGCVLGGAYLFFFSGQHGTARRMPKRKTNDVLWYDDMTPEQKTEYGIIPNGELAPQWKAFIDGDKEKLAPYHIPEPIAKAASSINKQAGYDASGVKPKRRRKSKRSA